MKNSIKVVLKVSATVLATVIGFFLGGWAGAAYCYRWSVPDLLKQNFTDGQIRFQALQDAIVGAVSAALIVFVLGAVLTMKTSKRGKNSLIKERS